MHLNLPKVVEQKYWDWDSRMKHGNTDWRGTIWESYCLEMVLNFEKVLEGESLVLPQ